MFIGTVLIQCGGDRRSPSFVLSATLKLTQNSAKLVKPCRTVDKRPREGLYGGVRLRA